MALVTSPSACGLARSRRIGSTISMTRVIRSGPVVLLVSALLVLAGCGSSKPPVSNPPAGNTTNGQATPTGSGSPSPSTSPGDVVEFSVHGAGPYLLGSKLAALQTAGKLGSGTPPGGQGCPAATTAHRTC